MYKIISIIALVLLGFLIFSSQRQSVTQGFLEQYQTDPIFRTHCNDAMRTIGKQAYLGHRMNRAFFASKDLSFCNYGYIVGYVESLLGHRGSVGQAERLCNMIKMKNTGAAHGYMECLKGIGTGAVSTSVCERVTRDENELNICVVGVMNKLAENYTASFARGPLAKLEDLFGNCALVPARYQPQCYGSMAGMTIWSGRETFESALTLAAQIPNREGQIRATRIIAKISMNKGKKTEEYINGCRSLPDFLKNQCFISLVQGAMELGTPGNEWKDGFAVCKNSGIFKEEQKLCVQFVLYQTETVLGGKSAVDGMCVEMTSEWKPYCVDYQKDYFSL